MAKNNNGANLGFKGDLHANGTLYLENVVGSI